MVRIFSFRKPRASAIIPPVPEQQDVGGVIPDDIRLAIKRCRRQHSEQTPMYDCLRSYLVWRGDLEIHHEHEYASDIAGGEVS